MKFSTSFVLFVVIGLTVCSQALPARKRMAYYQQPSSYYSAPQRMMYMQYVQPSYGNARSAQAASALVAGDTVATGTYLQETDVAAAAAGPTSSFSVESSEDVIGAAGAHVAHSVAEAYPAEEKKIAVKVDLGAQDKAVSVELPAVAAVNSAESEYSAKEGRQYYYDTPAGSTDVEVNLDAGSESDVGVSVSKNVESGAAFDVAETASANTVSVGISGSAESDAPAGGSASKGIDVSVSLPAPAPLAPVVPAVKPARRYLPAQKSKKVIVELEHSAENEADNAIATQDDDEDVDVEEEETDVAPVVPVVPAKVPARRRPAVKKPGKAGAAGCTGCTKAAKPLPAGTFFPVDFGGATGGAIAIANSFSTGEGGAATSHAIAYGTPEQARTRVRPSRRH